MNLKINHSSPLPLCAQVKEILRKMIALPEHINGRFLSKEVYLAKKLGISRNTLWLATKIAVERLKIKQREPVQFRERFVSDSGNRPVESNICFYIGEKYTYSIEIRR